MAKNLDKLLEKFNKLDTNPMSTRDYILSLEQAKAGVKNLTQKEAKELFQEELTDDDIKQLREAREREVAIKRGLIAGNAGKTTSKRTRTIAKAGKLNSSLRALVPLKNQATAEENQLQKLKQEFQPQARIIKENVPVKSSTENSSFSFNSGINLAPKVVKKEEEINLDDDYTAGFDYDFLISMEGKLNKDVLLDILISTWDEYYDLEQDLKMEEKERKKRDKLKDEQDKESGSLLGNLLLPLLLGWKWLKQLPKFLWKGIKNSAKFIGAKLKAIVKGVMDVLKNSFKAVKDWIVNFFKRAKNSIKNFFKGVIETAKNAVKNAKNAIKNFLKSATESVKNFFARAKQSVKNLFAKAKNVVKNFFESSKNVVKNMFKNIKDFGKTIAEKSKNIFKSASNFWKKGKDFFLKWKNKFLDLLKAAKNALKNGGKTFTSFAKSLWNKLTKKKPPVPKSGVKPKKPIKKPPKAVKPPKKTSVKPNNVKNAGKLKNAKNIEKSIAEIGGKQGLKKASKFSLGKALVAGAKKIPIVSSAIDIGFNAYEINEIEKELGVSRDEAMKIYLDRKKDEGFTWWHLIDWYGAGQQIAFKLGVDKATESIVDKVYDYFSEDPKERAERIRKEARENMLKKMEKELPKDLKKKLEVEIKARADELKLLIPKDLENPNYRLKNQTPIPRKGKRGTAIVYQGNPFPQDNDDFLYNNYQTPIEY